MSSTASLAGSLALIANPQTFSGVSKYSADMQSILVRTQQIAQIPVTALQNDQTTLKSEVTALTTLQTGVDALATAVTALGALASSGALTASSNNTNVTVSVSGAGATAGTYTIGKITSLAAVSTATMTDPIANPASTAVAPAGNNTLYLKAGGVAVPIVLTAATNNLNGLRDAINGANAGVTASILTTSLGSYLTMSASVAGATTITLNTAADNSGTEAMTMNTTGSLARFEVNGKAATSTTNQVSSVIPGVIFSLKGLTAAGETATVSVSGTSAAVATALQTMATAYNALSTSISTLSAQGTGVLAGNQVIRSIQSLMRGLAFQQGSGTTGGINSTMDIGISLDKQGVMTVNSSTLSVMSAGQLSNVLSFIGDGTKGLSSLAGGLSNYSDIKNGVLHQSIAQDQASEQRLQDQIDNMNIRIQVAQKTQMAKLQKADAMLALLGNQQSMLTSTLQSLTYTLYGVSNTSSNTKA